MIAIRLRQLAGGGTEFGLLFARTKNRESGFWFKY